MFWPLHMSAANCVKNWVITGAGCLKCSTLCIAASGCTVMAGNLSNSAPDSSIFLSVAT